MNKVWFVTGSSSGIGAGIVRSALGAGHRVVATARNMDKLRSALGKENDRLAFVSLDVTDAAQARAAVEAAVARFGTIDVLVNNAGYSAIGNIEAFSDEEIRKQLDTNFYGVLNVMSAALPTLRKQRSGYIINVSSVAGVIAYGTVGAYAASKFAVEGLSLSVAQEVERFGIKLTVVQPGFFRTDLLAEQSVVFASREVEGYPSPAEVNAQWQKYNQTQPGDPDKLGAALVALSALDSPPKQFAAGPDALDAIGASLRTRLEELEAHRALSVSTNGAY